MHLHTAKEVDNLLSTHLPYGYAKKALESAEIKERNVSQNFIRQVKNFNKKDLQILNILIALAKTHKAVAEAESKKLEDLIPKKENL